MHYHGYLYRPIGHGKPPSDFDERYRTPWGEFWDTSPWVPTVVAWWLMKPASFIKHTSATVDEAMAWAESIYRPQYGPEGPDLAKEGMTIDERLEYARADLGRGQDVVLHGPFGYEFTEIWLLSCPNAVYPPPPCPIGRTDPRPDRLSRLTGVPLYKTS
jgi:hypothetical protein